MTSRMQGYVVRLRGVECGYLVFADAPSTAKGVCAEYAADAGWHYTSLRARRANLADAFAALAREPRLATEGECAALGFDGDTCTFTLGPKGDRRTGQPSTEQESSQ